MASPLPSRHHAFSTCGVAWLIFVCLVCTPHFGLSLDKMPMHNVSFVLPLNDAAAGDINGDGTPDIVTVGDDTVYWFDGKQLDDATPQLIASMTVMNSQLYHVAVGDVTQDGQPDVVFCANSLVAYAVNVDFGRSFDGPFIIQESTSIICRHIVIADVDSNGRNDVIVASQGAAKGLILHNNTGDGFFGSFIERGRSMGKMKLADMNGDGLLDIIASDAGVIPSGVYFYPSQLNAVKAGQAIDLFDNPAKLASFGDSIEDIDIADLDRDNDPDVLVLTSSTLHWVELDQGTNSGGAPISIAQGLESARSIVATDLDDVDGIDVAFCGGRKSRPGTVVGFFSNVLRGDFGQLNIIEDSRYPIGNAIIAVEVSATSPFSELVVAGSLLALHSDVQAETPSFSLIAQSDARGLTALAHGDVDGDDDVDVVASASEAGTIVLFKNGDGLGGFSRPASTVAINVPGVCALELADLDGKDGLDIAFVSPTMVGYYYNDGTGQFSGFNATMSGSFSCTVAVADLDDNNRPDIITGLRSDDAQTDSVVALSFDSSTFEDPPTLKILTSNVETLHHVSVSDLDGSGRPDIVCAIGKDTPSSLLSGLFNVDGTFSFLVALIASSQQVNGISFATTALLNGDIAPDILATTDGNGGIVKVLKENEQGPMFDTPELIHSFGSGRLASSLTVVDLDNSGRLDIVGAASAGGSAFARQVFRLEQRGGPGEFRFAGYVSDVKLRFNHVRTADLDGDGDADIIASAGDRIVWFENLMESPSPPNITLIGDTEIVMELGDLFSDLGAHAFDAAGNSLTVVTRGTVPVFEVGTFILSYSATDSAGRHSMANRTVTVVDSLPPIARVKRPLTFLVKPNVADLPALQELYGNDTVQATDLSGTARVSSNFSELVDAVSFPTQRRSQVTIRYTARDANGNVADPVSRTGIVICTIYHSASPGSAQDPVDSSLRATGAVFVDHAGNLVIAGSLRIRVTDMITNSTESCGQGPGIFASPSGGIHLCASAGSSVEVHGSLLYKKPLTALDPELAGAPRIWWDGTANILTIATPVGKTLETNADFVVSGDSIDDVLKCNPTT